MTMAPQDVEGDAEEDIATERAAAEVSQFRLMVRRFRQSKLSVIAAICLAFMYFVMIFAGFFMINDPMKVDTELKNAPPSRLTITSNGLQLCAPKQELDQDTLTYMYVPRCDDESTLKQVNIFGRGHEYKLWGLIPTDRHILAVQDSEQPLLLWGADLSGRDVYSRTVLGSRVSLTIGVISVLFSTVVSAIIGTISGFFGGQVDNIIQRISEIFMSVPTLPLLMVLSAVLPKSLSVSERFFLISLILVVVNWPGLARQVRAKTASFAASDFVTACRADGGSNSRIIFTHLMPNSISHLVVVACLSVPAAIGAETGLSFLGLGMQEPAVSWGVLLGAAQETSVVTSYQWILIPGLCVIIAVTLFQLIGDGLRDAVDPYGG